MSKISKKQYEYALNRVEELLPVVDDSNLNDPKVIELSLVSDVVMEYEKEHYPIEKPSVAELIAMSLEEHDMTQKELASDIGVSPSRVNDFVSGRAEPSLRIAASICRVLGISPAVMMGL